MLRFVEIEAELEALAESRVVDGDPTMLEGECSMSTSGSNSSSGRITWTAAMDDEERELRFRERFDATAAFVARALLSRQVQNLLHL